MGGAMVPTAALRPSSTAASTSTMKREQSSSSGRDVTSTGELWAIKDGQRRWFCLFSPRRPGPDGGGGEEAHDEATPLHLCCQWGLEETVAELIEHGANVNAKVNWL